MAFPFRLLPRRVLERLGNLFSAVLIKGAALLFAVLAQTLKLPAAAADGLVLRRGKRLAAELAGDGLRLALRLAASPLSGLTKPRSARRLALCGQKLEVRTSLLEVLDVWGLLQGIANHYIWNAVFSPLLQPVDSLPVPAKIAVRHYVMLAVKWLLVEVLLAGAKELVESVSAWAAVVVVLAGVYFLCSLAKDRLLSSSSCEEERVVFY